MALMDEAADRHGLPRGLVKAVVMAESAYDTFAIKFEPQYRWFFGNVAAMSPTEKSGQATSWGLMQVMGAVAREYGYAGSLVKLSVPEIGIEYGCLHLKRFHQRYPENWQDVIASYNAGSPRVGLQGKYTNQVYVDKVLRWWNGYEIAVPIKHTGE